MFSRRILIVRSVDRVNGNEIETGRGEMKR